MILPHFRLLTVSILFLNINAWYHGDGLKSTIDGLRRFIENDKPRWDPWIGYVDDQAFSLLMVSTIQDDENSHLSKWIIPGKKMITLDLLIGEEQFLGQGLATPMIQQFLVDHYSDVDIVFIDPECANEKAIHVYEKAGFEKLATFIASWYPVPHWLMRLKR